MKKNIPVIGFTFFLLIIYGLNNYHVSTFLPPMGIHAWRQADCASFSLNFHQNGMNFFNPEIHNLHADNNTSGYGVSEAPIMNYIVALLYKIFGVHDWLFRVFNLLISSISLISIFCALKNYFKHAIWPVTILSILFSSTVYLYYANNFLTDITAFHLIILACAQFLYYITDKKSKRVFFLFLFVTLAGLLKITSLIPFIAFGAIFIVSLLFKTKFKFEKRWQWAIGFLVTIIILSAWYSYVIYFNKKHGTSYFANDIFPFYKYSADRFKIAIDNIWLKWRKDYFNMLLYYFLPIGIISSLLIIKKHTLYSIFYFLITVGSIGYILFWFEKFNDHDYYFTPIFTLFLLSLTSIALLINQLTKNHIIIGFVSILIIGLMIHPIIDTSKREKRRYTRAAEELNYATQFIKTGKALKELGFNRDTKVISLNDYTFALSLYLLDMKGWTAINDITKPTTLYHYIEEFGAELLAIKGDENVKNYQIQELLANEVYQNGDIHIFDIRNAINPFKTFSFDTIMCNAEKTTPDGRNFTSNYVEIIIAGANMRNSEKKFDGDYSILINSNSPYGFTCMVPNISPDDSLTVSAYKYGKPEIGTMVCNGNSWNYSFSAPLNPLENNTTQDQWYKTQTTFVIPSNFKKGEIEVFFHNSSKEDIFLDNLQIIKHKQ